MYICKNMINTRVNSKDKANKENETKIEQR